MLNLIHLLLLAQAFSPPDPTTYTITFAADGTFSPTHLVIREDDLVQFASLDDDDSVEQVRLPKFGEWFIDNCTLEAGETDFANQFSFSSFATGADDEVVSGIWLRGPTDSGFIQIADTETCDCEPGCTPEELNGLKLCTNEAPLTIAESWAYPWSEGYLVVLDWDDVEPTNGGYVWTTLDRELQLAEDNSKGIIIAFRAGVNHIPGWLFSGGGVVGVTTKDFNGDTPDTTDCGTSATLGSPSDDNLRLHLVDLIEDMATHINTDVGWEAALKQVKILGLNNTTDEAKLPKNAYDGDGNGQLDTINGDPCIANTKNWALAGYTPNELYEFYGVIEAALVANFPDQSMGYMLIQSGFPRVVSPTNWFGDTLRDQSGVCLLDANSDNICDGNTGDDIGGLTQTTTIINQGMATHTDQFMVYHNGLGPLPADQGGLANCAYAPAIALTPSPPHAVFPLVFTTPLTASQAECPNRWVVNAGAFNNRPTGLQTNNVNQISTAAHVESSFWNASIGSNAVAVEIYEFPAWMIQNGIGTSAPLDPTRTSLPGTNPAPFSKTITQWSTEFLDRGAHYSNEPPAVGRTYRMTAPGTYAFLNPATCPNAPLGRIRVRKWGD